ncbi:MAG: TIM barrel protein, partial [Anaerotignum sp.]|nr:TIM barrel protein [Anaerotignum sp.]
MLHIGCHLSASKGYLAMGKDAVKIHADTFQFFTRNPRGGSAKPLNAEDMQGLQKILEENGFARIVAHAPYTLNACAADPGLREFARNTMADDLMRLEYLPGNYYNFHPGSHVKQGAEVGIELIAQTLNAVLRPE